MFVCPRCGESTERAHEYIDCVNALHARAVRLMVAHIEERMGLTPSVGNLVDPQIEIRFKSLEEIHDEQVQAQVLEEAKAVIASEPGANRGEDTLVGNVPLGQKGFTDGDAGTTTGLDSRWELGIDGPAGLLDDDEEGEEEEKEEEEENTVNLDNT